MIPAELKVKKTITAMRSARSFAPSPKARMKNDSIWPGVRPTVKSTATSGKKIPRLSVRRMSVTTSAPPPASAPAASRCHGNRRRNEEIALSVATTPAERAARRLNLCQPCESRPILYLARGSCSEIDHARLVQFPDASGSASCPHRVLDHHLRSGSGPRSPSGFVGSGRPGAASLRFYDGGPHLGRGGLRRDDPERLVGNRGEPSEPEALRRLDRRSRSRPDGNDRARVDEIRAAPEVGRPPLAEENGGSSVPTESAERVGSPGYRRKGASEPSMRRR